MTSRLPVAGKRQAQLARADLINHAAVLRVHAKLERLLAVGIQGKEVAEAIRAAMKYAPAQIDGGIDERMRGPALFGLDVISVASNRHVGVVTKWHVGVRPRFRANRSRPRRDLLRPN